MNSTGLQKIRLERLLAVQYQHPNLAEAKRFFVDFGLNIVRQDEEKVFFRGFGADAFCYIAEQSEDRRRHFVGGIWLVHSIDDLEAASKLPGASRLESSSAPGGGKCVELVDPVGLKVTLVYGIHARAEESVANEAPGDVTINSWINKPRKGVFQRFVRGPSKVHKCGHYGVAVDEASFDEELSWYLTTFTLATTDTICDGETGKDLMVFLHLDKGEEYVDHHVRISLLILVVQILCTNGNRVFSHTPGADTESELLHVVRPSKNQVRVCSSHKFRNRQLRLPCDWSRLAVAPGMDECLGNWTA